jgi:hypothetical protein
MSSTGTTGSSLKSSLAKTEILAAFKTEGITDLDGLATHIESIAKPQGAGSEHTLVTTKGWVLQISER